MQFFSVLDLLLQLVLLVQLQHTLLQVPLLMYGNSYGYSNYFVSSPDNIGSKSSVTNFWGTVKAQDKQDYGWAYSSATKSWSDVRLNAYWDYYRF